MSKLSLVGIACGETAFSMFCEAPEFKPERMYQYMDEGQVIHVCAWEWTDWTDFGYNAPQVDWIRYIIMLLDNHESERDTKFGYKMVKIDENYDAYSVEFNPPGEDFDIGLKVSLDIPSGADLIM